MTLNPAVDRTVSVSNLALGAGNRAELVGGRAGGKGVNVAAALAEQGHRVVALGFLGRENVGIFERFFAASGVEGRFTRLAGATRTGIKIVDTARGGTTDLNFPGLAPTREELAELEARIDGVEAGWCVLAGSLPPDVPTEFYADATRRLKARGVRVALDTSGEAIRAGARSRTRRGWRRRFRCTRSRGRRAARMPARRSRPSPGGWKSAPARSRPRNSPDALLAPRGRAGNAASG